MRRRCGTNGGFIQQEIHFSFERDWVNFKGLDLTQFDLSQVENRLRHDLPGGEAIAVAKSALHWWEKHKNDTTTIDGVMTFRYPTEPDFVIQAQAIVARSIR